MILRIGRLAIILLLSPALAFAADEPKLSTIKNEYKLYLPAAANKALLSFRKDFSVAQLKQFDAGYINHYSYTTRQAPFAVVGDFNADGKKDVVVLGYSKQGYEIIALLSYHKKYNAIKIASACSWGDSNPPLLWSSLTYAAPGKYHNPLGNSNIILKHDGFQMGCEEKGGSLYYFDNNHATFVEIINGD